MAAPPPPGLDLDVDIRSIIIGPVVTLMVLATISVALRITSRLTSKLQLQWDDYLILLALVSSVVFIWLRGTFANRGQFFAYGTGVLSIIGRKPFLRKEIVDLEKDADAVASLSLWRGQAHLVARGQCEEGRPSENPRISLSFSFPLSQNAVLTPARRCGRMSGRMAPWCPPPSSLSSCSTTVSSPSGPSPTPSTSAPFSSLAGGWPCTSSSSSSAAPFPTSGSSTSTRQPRENASTSTSSSSATPPPVSSQTSSSCWFPFPLSGS